MPYGLHSVSEVFHGKISKIVCGIKNARNFQDDITVWGKIYTLITNAWKRCLRKLEVTVWN